jgi:predicted dehydrogenase
MSSPCRWGVLGTANIARKNWKAIRLAGNSTVTAVASRDPARAAAFVAECQSEVPFPAPPAAVGYADLLRRDDVDAVYVPLPTGVRREWVVRAAEAGKHVLCEKPCGPSAADVRAMTDACRANRVQFMDGVMFMHSRRLPLLRQVLDDGTTVGELRRIASQFSFAAPAEFFGGNIRTAAGLEPLGCLGDLGWYNVRFSLWVMNYALPERVAGRTLAAHGGVPTEFAADLFFPGGVTAAFYCSFRTENQQWAHVSGSRGSVRVPDFVLPFHGPEAAFESDTPVFDVAGCTFRMGSHPRRHAVHEYGDGAANAQETNMVRTFADLAKSGNPDDAWPDIALRTQRVVDACLASAAADGRPVAVGE